MKTVGAMEERVLGNKGMSWKAKMQVYCSGGVNDNIWLGIMSVERR